MCRHVSECLISPLRPGSLSRGPAVGLEGRNFQCHPIPLHLPILDLSLHFGLGKLYYLSIFFSLIICNLQTLAIQIHWRAQQHGLSWEYLRLSSELYLLTRAVLLFLSVFFFFFHTLTMPSGEGCKQLFTTFRVKGVNVPVLLLRGQLQPREQCSH